MNRSTSEKTQSPAGCLVRSGSFWFENRWRDVISVDMPSLTSMKAIAIPMTVLCLLAGCARFEARPLLPQRTAADFEARTLDSPDLRAFIEKNLKGQMAQWPPQEWDLRTFTLVAIYYHPSLDVARAQWGVAKAGRITAGQRPNPTLSLAPQYTTNAESGVSPWVAPVAVDVPFETAGKRGLRRAVAEHLSEVRSPEPRFTGLAGAERSACRLVGPCRGPAPRRAVAGRARRPAADRRTVRRQIGRRCHGGT